MKIFLFLILSIGTFTHCQDRDELIFSHLESIMSKQEALINKLNGLQEKLDNSENSIEELKRSNAENQQNQNEILQKLEELGQECSKPNDFAIFKKETQAEQERASSSLLQKIEAVIILSQTDECSLGDYSCGPLEACIDLPLGYKCDCLPGFALNGSSCEEIDECAEGLDGCHQKATCVNTIGSYSCSCIHPYQGDGHTCGLISAWIGAYNGTWLNGENITEFDPRYVNNSNKRCGIMNPQSGVRHGNCLVRNWGYCQFD